MRFGFPVTLTPSTHCIKDCYFLWATAASVLGALYCPKRQKKMEVIMGWSNCNITRLNRCQLYFFKAERDYAICKGGQRKCEHQIHDEKMASGTLSIKENIAGNAIDQRMLIGQNQNTPSDWNFTEFLITCYQYTQNSFSSKTRILDKHTSGNPCGQHISKYSTSLSQKYYDLLQQPHAFYIAAATCITFENNFLLSFYCHSFNPLINAHVTFYSSLHAGKPRTGQMKLGTEGKES